MGQKMGKKAGKMELPEEALENYIRSEFRAMDSNQDGKLHRNEVLKLLTLLGYDKGEQKLKTLHVKSEDEVEMEDYVKAFKKDKALCKNTGRFRQWFVYFDKNNDGTATKEEVLSGLEEVSIKVDKELQKTVEQMDANHDGKITYEEFLVTQFRISLEEKSKKSSE